jgi:hypothetical protein
MQEKSTSSPDWSGNPFCEERAKRLKRKQEHRNQESPNHPLLIASSLAMTFLSIFYHLFSLILFAHSQKSITFANLLAKKSFL